MRQADLLVRVTLFLTSFHFARSLEERIGGASSVMGRIPQYMTDGSASQLHTHNVTAIRRLPKPLNWPQNLAEVTSSKCQTPIAGRCLLKISKDVQW
jgi:hypothetical protein